MYTSNPVINSSLGAAQQPISLNPQRLLIVGQIGSDGTAVSTTPYQDVQNMTGAQIKTLFGTKSELTNRILKVLTVVGTNVSVWVVAITAAAGSAATFVQAITGTATAAGTITLKLIDSNLYTIQIPVSSGDSNTIVATAIMTAISALGALFPATAVNSPAGTITYTANDVGTLGNKYTIQVSGVPAGLTVPQGQFASGATDPTFTSILTNVSATRFHGISWPWQTAYTVVDNFLKARNVINNAVLQGLAYLGFDDTEANIHSTLNGGSPINSPVLIFCGNRQVAGVSYIITPPDWRAAEIMSIEALRLTPNSSIGQYITSSAPLDQLGGPGLASMPLFNTPLPLTDVQLPDNLFSAIEQANALTDGFSVIGVNASVTEAITGQMCTSYKYNTLGQPDPSFKFVEYIRTAFTALEFMFNSLKIAYAQMRLTQDQPIAGRAMVNITGIFNFFVSMFGTLSGPDYVLTPSGKSAMSFFKSNLTISANYSTGTVNVIGLLPIVTQLRTINMPFNLNFTVGGN